MSVDPFDKRMAAALARPMRKLPISPNAITALGLIVGLMAAILFAKGERAAICWGGGLFMLAMFLDHLDGEFARISQQTSRFGHYFDRLTAAVVYTSTFIGVGIGQKGGALGPWAIYLSVTAGISIGLIFAVRNIVESRHGHEAIEQPSAGAFEIEDCLYLIAPIAWLDILTPLLLLAGLGAPAYLVVTLIRASRGKA